MSTSTSQRGMATEEADGVYEHTHTNASTEMHKGQETSSTGRGGKSHKRYVCVCKHALTKTFCSAASQIFQLLNRLSVIVIQGALNITTLI